MRLLTTLTLLLMTVGTTLAADDFATQQKQYPRVREAYRQKEALLQQNLTQHGLSFNDLHIVVVAYKKERTLEIYGKCAADAAYKKIATYAVCASSGVLGPKRRQGDRQVPEGFYQIDRFNPSSNYHLSLGVDYPNASDRRKSTAENLGGDIFIHGSCVTIGCLPLTDDKIREVYLYAVQARNSGQRQIPVYVFPFRMTEANMQSYRESYRKNPDLVAFWENLRQGYDRFQTDFKALQVSVDHNGNYLFRP